MRRFLIEVALDALILAVIILVLGFIDVARTRLTENAIRALPNGVGLNHPASGRFAANAPGSRCR
jgi:hypothetical protein